MSRSIALIICALSCGVSGFGLGARYGAVSAVSCRDNFDTAIKLADAATTLARGFADERDRCRTDLLGQLRNRIDSPALIYNGGAALSRPIREKP